jgi:2-polyprenyl-3-methyl-5-hydroxy-6-metoxy-1,4-benzoquinol methylase
LGCGAAEFSDWIPAHVEYVGCERDPECSSAARLLRPRIKLIQCDIEDPNWDFPMLSGQPFDTVVALAVVEHLSDPFEILVRVRRLLGDSGVLVLTTPVRSARWILRISSLLGLTSREASGEHRELLAKADLLDLLSRSGFKVRHYQRFLLGFNQLLVCVKNESWPN